MKINVSLADDHPIVVDGLQNLLKDAPGMHVLDVYSSGKDLLAGLKQRQPDVLLLDLQFPDSNGKDLAAEIRRRYPAIRILILSSIENIYDIREVMQQGAKGYLLKNVQPQVLIRAIETVYKGDEFLEQSLKEELLKSLFNPLKEKIKLTQREKRILDLIAQGKTSMEIAELLFLSYRTIQNNRATLYEKFEVHNSIELVKVAMQLGLIN